EIIRTQLGPVPIPNGLGRLLEGPINAQIVNATQGRPFEITGVEVNEALIQKQSFKFWEAPHLRRRDGSVTNW
ncbi:MAG: hypothetical protein J0H20_20475, partial [Rhizobiales bacterium]|nr:hypothetical protein [Hyphomicrobiales bacterium]